MNLNATTNGELVATNVVIPVPWWLEIFGVKSKPIVNKMISTDYTNFAVIYYCNEANTWFKHDEVYYLLRDIKKGMSFLGQANEIINKIGYDVNAMKRIDHESKICEQLKN